MPSFLLLVWHRLRVGLSCFLHEKLCFWSAFACSLVLLSGRAAVPLSLDFPADELGRTLPLSFPPSSPVMMQYYESISCILRDWNLCWIPQLKLIVHLEAAQDLRLLSYCAVSSLFNLLLREQFNNQPYLPLFPCNQLLQPKLIGSCNLIFHHPG